MLKLLSHFTIATRPRSAVTPVMEGHAMHPRINRQLLAAPAGAVLTLLALFSLAPRALADCSTPGGLHINEVRYLDQNLPDDGYLTPLVEIFNKGASPISLANHVITAADGTVKAALPAWIVPPGGFLEVRFAAGSSDSDFTDGLGTYFTNGDSINVFQHDADGVALADSLGATLVDVRAWSSTGGSP